MLATHTKQIYLYYDYDKLEGIYIFDHILTEKICLKKKKKRFRKLERKYKTNKS